MVFCEYTESEWNWTLVYIGNMTLINSIEKSLVISCSCHLNLYNSLQG